MIFHIIGHKSDSIQQFTKYPDLIGHPSLRFAGKGGDGSQKGIRKHVQSNDLTNKGFFITLRFIQNDSPPQINSMSISNVTIPKRLLLRLERVAMTGSL